jgi:hypothetical protein
VREAIERHHERAKVIAEEKMKQIQARSGQAAGGGNMPMAEEGQNLRDVMAKMLANPRAFKPRGFGGDSGSGDGMSSDRGAVHAHPTEGKCKRLADEEAADCMMAELLAKEAVADAKGNAETQKARKRKKSKAKAKK